MGKAFGQKTISSAHYKSGLYGSGKTEATVKTKKKVYDHLEFAEQHVEDC